MTNIQEILEIGLEEYLAKHKIVGYKQKVIMVFSMTVLVTRLSESIPW